MITTRHQSTNKNQGSILVSILIVSLFLTVTVFALIGLANANLTRSRERLLLLQAQYSAESGVDSAIAILNSGNDAYSGSAGEVQVVDNPRYKATFTTNVVAGSDPKEKIITATGKLYSPKDSPNAKFTRKIEVISKRTSSSGSVSLASRNILEVSSGVKTLKAKDILVNGFISLNKNTTELVAEKITVADKKTSATNCSIGGTGKLTKPVSFTDPAQTKTQIKVAYNNCISPPGNSGNSNFDVQTSQTDIQKIQSTFIPWNQYMNNSYTNASSGCNDWTTGSFPRNIPSSSGSKKTHYPDSATGLSSSCGTSGSLELSSGQYNINDHTHIRASLCAINGCSPTFYNPDTGASGIKFVFVEGAINFSSLQTASGSGPIVFIAYGSDPESKSSVCPYGGSLYLGNNGTTSAPAAYLIATNGICLSKTKFGSAYALGGISGKNIYIDTNPGTPFDLGLDPSFPSQSIPIDLFWKATRYRKL